MKTHNASELVLSDAEIVRRLQSELPHWIYENGWIKRKIKTSGWKATLMVVNTVGHLAEKAWHHPDLNVSYAFVIIKLVTHSAKGITEKDFALAKKIEEVVLWDAESDSNGVLEGTPDDPRFKYLSKYNKLAHTIEEVMDWNAADESDGIFSGAPADSHVRYVGLAKKIEDITWWQTSDKSNAAPSKTRFHYAGLAKKIEDIVRWHTSDECYF